MQTSQFWPVVWGLVIIGAFCVLFVVLWEWQRRLWRQEQVELPEDEQDEGHRDEYTDDLAKAQGGPAEDEERRSDSADS